MFKIHLENEILLRGEHKSAVGAGVPSPGESQQILVVSCCGCYGKRMLLVPGNL